MAKGRQNRRSARATSLIETVVALILGLPIVIAIIFVIVECCSYFLIQANVDAATRKATRDLSVEWGKDPTVATDGSKQQAIFADCLIPGFVNDPAQFSAPVFDGSDPPTVTVIGTYAAGQYRLAPFPHPNPLGITGDFTIRSEATYRLE